MNVSVNLEALFGLVFLGGGGKLLDFQGGLRLLQDRERVAALVNETVDGNGVGRIDGFEERGWARPDKQRPRRPSSTPLPRRAWPHRPYSRSTGRQPVPGFA